jgi:hypothetical protein
VAALTAAQRLQARIDKHDLWGVEADIREVLAENDQLTRRLIRVRTIARNWQRDGMLFEKALANQIIAALERDEAAERPLTPGVPGYACARCGSLFTSPGEPRDEHSRHADSPWCRGCVDLCHEGGDGHRCVICASKSEGVPQ